MSESQGAVAGHGTLVNFAIAFVIPSPDVSEVPPDLVQLIVTACCEQLAGFKVAHEVRFVDDLPHAKRGKVAKAELRKRLADEP